MTPTNQTTAPRARGAAGALIITVSLLLAAGCANTAEALPTPAPSSPLPTPSAPVDSEPAPSGDASASASPTSDPAFTPAAPPTVTEPGADRAADEAAAKAAVYGYLDVANASLQNPTTYDPWQTASAVAIDDAIGVLAHDQGRQAEAGLHNVGGSKITSLEIVNYDMAGADGTGVPTIEFTACVASDDVVVYKGDEVYGRGADFPAVKGGYWTIYDTTKEPYGWKVQSSGNVAGETC